METYPVDIDPGQLVHWLKAEHEASPGTFRITVTRRGEVRDILVRKESHLGDGEREDLSETATTASLEVAPVHAGDGWHVVILPEIHLACGRTLDVPRKRIASASLSDIGLPRHARGLPRLRGDAGKDNNGGCGECQ
jgi:hypothetical protein